VYLARNDIEVHNARAAIVRTGELADNLIRVGPFGIGLDGLLTWIPVVGLIYSLGAGAILIGSGVRARAPVSALAAALGILLLRSGVGEIPLAGQVAVDLVRGHRWAARLLAKAIDETLYLEGHGAASVQGRDALGAIRSRGERRRVVFLGQSGLGKGAKRFSARNPL
jgi:hypothetical protein